MAWCSEAAVTDQCCFRVLSNLTSSHHTHTFYSRQAPALLEAALTEAEAVSASLTTDGCTSTVTDAQRLRDVWSGLCFLQHALFEGLTAGQIVEGGGGVCEAVQLVGATQVCLCLPADLCLCLFDACVYVCLQVCARVMQHLLSSLQHHAPLCTHLQAQVDLATQLLGNGLAWSAAFPSQVSVQEI